MCCSPFFVRHGGAVWLLAVLGRGYRGDSSQLVVCDRRDSTVGLHGCWAPELVEPRRAADVSGEPNIVEESGALGCGTEHGSISREGGETAIADDVVELFVVATWYRP